MLSGQAAEAAAGAEKYAGASSNETEGGKVKENTKQPQAQEGLPLYDSFESREEYQRTVRKVWWRIVPYFSFIDRVNIGQAKLAGLTQNIGASNSEYNISLAMFFVTYVIFEVPSNMILRRTSPRIFVSIIIILWSICATLMALVQTPGQLIAVRVLLGICESGLFPGLNYVLSLWLPSSVLATATGVFFAGATLSGAFGGLLAFGLRHVGGTLSGIHGNWRLILLFEGLLTFVAGLPAYWLVVDWPEKDTVIFKSDHERKRWINELSRTQSVLTAPLEAGTKSQVFDALLDWRTYVFAIIYSGIAEQLYSVSLFLPTIIAALGFTNAAANALSAAPFGAAFIFCVVTGLLSDKFRRRGAAILGVMSISSVGLIILLTEVSNGVKFFATFLVTMGCCAGIGLSISWVATQFGPSYKRATGMGIHFSSGNSAGIVSSFVFPSDNSPRFIRGYSIALGLGLFSMLNAAILSWANARENKRRDENYGKVDNDMPLEEILHPSNAERWGLKGMTNDEQIKLGDKHPSVRFLI